MAALLFCISSFIFKSSESLSSVLRTSKNKLKLPRKVHLTLTEKDIKNRHIFVIGDVHGCLEELEELLRLAKQGAKNKSILPIFVGDLANKGPHNAETIKKIRKMDAYAVRGNHEEAVIKNIMNLQENADYVLRKKYEWIKELDQDDIDYLIELPYTIHIPSKKALIVHAGILPGIPLNEQNLTDLITLRNLYEDGDKLVTSEYRDKGVPWSSLWPGPDHVYFGHDAFRKLQQYQYATGLDTGCLYGFSLTGIFVDSKKLLQVKARKVYVHPGS